MKKKTGAVLLGSIIAWGFIVPFAGCAPEKVKGPDTDQPKSEAPVWDSHVTLSDNGALVEWDEVEGAKEYKVYYSPSRFNTFEYASTETECEYYDLDKYGYFRVDAVDEGGTVLSSEIYSYELETFGENTHIYSSTDNQDLILNDVNSFRESTGQFSDLRYAGLFKAGVYNNLDLQMRYYMTFAGLGDFPTETTVNGLKVYGELAGGNSTCNFWMGVENLTVKSNVQWAVSQATSFRRMNLNGNLTLHDTGSTPWASGGFISDTVVKGKIDGTVQQQWFTRNSDWASWTGVDINMVYAGCTGELNNYNWSNSNRVTYIENTTVMSEKPYLTFGGALGYSVCVPMTKKDFKGVSWDRNSPSYGQGDQFIPLNEFYVARSDRDTSDTINAALGAGKNILFTPGIYNIDKPVLVENPNTVVMGIGLATLRLTSKNNDTIMRVADVDGVRLSGLLFDAGRYSKTLLQIGTEKSDVRHSENPAVLNDLFFRIGGAGTAATGVDTTLEINSNDVVGDNFWVWRADHGNNGTVGWEINRTVNGVIVNGDHVTLYGLMVEHFHEYQTVWNGEYGYMVFYQSETPYDVEMESEWVSTPTEDDPDAGTMQYTTQLKWMSEWNGVTYQGYASYKVSDSVQNHEAYGLGVYYVASSRLKNTFTLDHAIELPSNSGISVVHMAIANFLYYGDGETYGGIRYIVNDMGTGSFNGVKNSVESFIGGVCTV